MKHTTPLINNDWDIILKDEFQKESFKELTQFVANEREKYSVFPLEDNVFSAFKLCSFFKTKVVIIGQDPYHRKGQAHGLAFSVPNGEKIPPSLGNIFKELQSDLNIPISRNGNLESWAKQGVFLLNATLTVREKEAGSHQYLAWEDFTDSVISKLSSEKNGLIFLLWGAFAQKKSVLINTKKHYILKTNHPSPLSAYRGFLGCKHFSKTNDILIQNNQKPIDWNLCISTSMSAQNDIIKKAKNYITENFNELLFISIENQEMHHIKNGKVIKTYSISSSSYGIGNKSGSNKTPVGLHRVASKFGSKTPTNGIMKSRVFYGDIATIYNDTTKSKTDDITSRIFWLEGLEQDKNKGKGIDSYKRYIYIHGTSEEGRLGTPASKGCIRMKNKDVIDLFKIVKVGTLVLIL